MPFSFTLQPRCSKILMHISTSDNLGQLCRIHSLLHSKQADSKGKALFLLHEYLLHPVIYMVQQYQVLPQPTPSHHTNIRLIFIKRIFTVYTMWLKRYCSLSNNVLYNFINTFIGIQNCHFFAFAAISSTLPVLTNKSSTVLQSS